MISGNDIKQLASLARIKLTDEEERTLATDMENILGYISQLQEVSGSLESEKNKQEKVRNVMRDDSNAYEPGTFTEDILNEAPAREGQYLKVKKIL